MRALIIDDDPQRLRLLECLLRDDPVASPVPPTVLTAATLSGALVLLDQQPVDVVLVAADLPDAQGPEVVGPLVARRPQLPVLVHTDDPEQAIDLIDHGAEDVIDVARLSHHELHRLAEGARRRRTRPARTEVRPGEDPTRLLLGEYTRAVAHDIRRPLATVQMLAQAIVNDHDHHAMGPTELARRIVARIDDLLEFTDVLLADSVADDGSIREVRLDPLVGRALDLHGGRADTSLVTVDVPDHLTVVGREGQLLHAVLNLLGNVAQHAGPAANVAISATSRDGSVLLLVDDDGPGVAPEDRERILAPGTRLTTATGGHGLGLAAVDLVARVHGGRVMVDDSPLGGLRVGLALPADTRAPRGQGMAEHRRS